MATSLSIDQLVRLAVKKDSLGNLGFSTIAETGALATADLSNLTQDQILRSIFSDNGDGTYGLNLFGIAGGGSGTVTTASVVSANGFTGTVANPTTTPAITVATSVTGLLKGNGTAVSAVVSGTDIKTVNGASILGSGDLVVSGGLTEYSYAVSGGSGGITARFYGTAGITVTRSAADTYQFNVPAAGYVQSCELNLPIADNTVAGYTLKWVYASPTFNTNFATMKPCVIQMMTDTGNVYVSRAAPAATDFASTPTIPTSGTLQHVVTVPSAIQGVVLKIVGKF